tara:strand:- start:101 stop:286 length:186 start_codon:yes stop_codon:yes gene_type:complete
MLIKPSWVLKIKINKIKNNPPDVGVLIELTNDLCFENVILSDKNFFLIIISLIIIIVIKNT